MIYQTVFDVAQDGYTTWWFPACGLIFICVGLLLVFGPALVLKVMPIRGPDLLDFLELLLFLPYRARRFSAGGFLSIAILWTLVTFSGTYGEYRTMVAALHDGRFEVVEGRVTEFNTMPSSGRSRESFVVGGHRFAWSKDNVTSGFQNSSSLQRPILEGRNVRVSYLGNSILRLEVAE